MRIKTNLMKAASIVAYVFTFIWFVVCASFFALGNNLYWLFLVLALVSLYSGFLVTSVREKMTSVKLEGKEKTKFIIYTVVSIASPVSFVLNLIALLWEKEDAYAVERIPVAAAAPQEAAVKPPKKFYRTRSFITMCVAFGLIFVCSFSAMCFETSGFSVKVSDFTLTREMTEQYNEGKIHGESYTITNDENPTYSVTMYVPSGATEENPAATVFVLPGFTRTKATMAQYCIELSRRGAVVFCMDPGGQGGTTETSTAGANGIEYLVQYVYNNDVDFKFCDKNRFGAVGHSAGGGNVCTLAADFSGETYAESVIKSVYISGYIKTSSANKYKNLRCNAAMSYAYYDEGAFRYQEDTNSFEVISLMFINNVNGEGVNSYDSLALDYGYGNMSDGTYRVVHREPVNHCFEMYDNLSIANTVNFFNESLDMGSDIAGSNQIWFGKEFSNGLALAAAFTFIIALCGVLMGVPLFATIKNKKNVAEGMAAVESGLEGGAEGGAPDGGLAVKTADCAAEACAQSEPAPAGGGAVAAAKEKKPKTVAHKIVFWTTIILTAIIACLDYIPLANLSIEIFPTGNSSSVYTYVFPARMVNAILLWASINGAIGLVLYFGTLLCENLYELVRYKVKGIAPAYDWGKLDCLKIRRTEGKGKVSILTNVLKMLLLALILIVAFYFTDQLCYWIFHQDFRFMLISAAPVNARMLVTALEYIPIIFIFYISNSIRVNGSVGREGWKEWQVMLVGALCNSIGLAFILLINYVCFFTTGSPYYGYWGNGTEIWLYVNMVFGLVVMMFLLPIFNRLFYKKTGSVWLGAIVCCTIFVMMTISASVSYIPMY